MCDPCLCWEGFTAIKIIKNNSLELCRMKNESAHSIEWSCAGILVDFSSLLHESGKGHGFTSVAKSSLCCVIPKIHHRHYYWKS